MSVTQVPERCCGRCGHWWHPEMIMVANSLRGCGNQSSDYYAVLMRENQTCPAFEPATEQENDDAG